MTFRLQNADTTLKLLITTYLVVLTVGYAVGLFFVEHTSSFSNTGVQEQFLGNEHLPNPAEMRFAKSPNEMFIFMHNHILSMALVLSTVGGIFYFSSIVSEKYKRLLIVEPIAAVLTTFGGIALVRYVSPYFSWLVIFSGASIFICYLVMVVLIFKELWVSAD